MNGELVKLLTGTLASKMLHKVITQQPLTHPHSQRCVHQRLSFCCNNAVKKAGTPKMKMLQWSDSWRPDGVAPGAFLDLPQHPIPWESRSCLSFASRHCDDASTGSDTGRSYDFQHPLGDCAKGPGKNPTAHRQDRDWRPPKTETIPLHLTLAPHSSDSFPWPCLPSAVRPMHTHMAISARFSAATRSVSLRPWRTARDAICVNLL